MYLIDSFVNCAEKKGDELCKDTTVFHKGDNFRQR